VSAARIHLLPQAVADAIAAGEVVERPASVVKELVENSVDAGARSVTVDVTGAGLVSIEVADDGAGIHEDDLQRAVERHATSKVREIRDLERVASLGFRGEALASIAAVSALTIRSRTADAMHGAELQMHSGGDVRLRPQNGGPAVQPASRTAGTTVTVTELFATTPARLRFLRSERAEAAAVQRAVSDLAVAHPDVGMVLTLDGVETLRTSGSGALRTALGELLGAAAAAALIDVHGTKAIAVAGCISPPHDHRGTRTGFVLIVNGRPVQHRGLSTAVDEAYRGLIPYGRHAYGVIRVDVDPACIDVNVHPAKREVRFLDERQAFAAVQRACWAALRSAPVQASAAFTASALHREWNGTAGYEHVDSALETHSPLDTQWLSTAPQVRDEPHGVADQSLASLGPLRAVGQANNEWIIAAGPSAIVIVDPHAAHEKALYVELLDSWDRGVPAAPQLLLLPVVLDVPPAALERLDGWTEILQRSGFGLEPFGPGLVRCMAVPAMCAGAPPERLVRELLDALAEGVDEGRRHRAAATIACHSAVRFGDQLDREAQQRILDRLVVTPGGSSCPHGRPTAMVLGDDSLRRAFRRPPR
jgi:DNA mismatch repair protein MutL